MNTYSIDWSNVDLKDAYNRDQGILDGLTFADVILYLDTSVREEDVTPENVLKYIKEELETKMQTALEIAQDNAKNISNHVGQTRIVSTRMEDLFREEVAKYERMTLEDLVKGEKYIKQDHFGNFLLMEVTEGKEEFQLWAEYPETGTLEEFTFQYLGKYSDFLHVQINANL